MIEAITLAALFCSCAVAFFIIDRALERAHQADMKRLREEIERMQ